MYLEDLAETQQLGRVLAESAYEGLIVLLDGELGTGKTELVRAIAARLGTAETRSPSFTLVNEYRGTVHVVHADLYRIAPEEVGELELEEYAREGALLLVEWAERWRRPPGSDVWRITLAFGEGVGTQPWNAPRSCRLTARGNRAWISLDGAMAALAGADAASAEREVE
ncbi:MAG: tRNA (adenosine(37)-N6)-threonylcarbamoyltransferase complex ATPase subunit type 1 TsaE [Synergistales bacterium]|nr:tRNA (adenosine(37)-N6)-threonylcarbamoyltransferase complex ATPase subunit type 1 TsaE [Synergistales bacterium]